MNVCINGLLLFYLKGIRFLMNGSAVLKAV